METSTAKRLLTRALEPGFTGMMFQPSVEILAEEVIEIHKAIAVFCREELGHMTFDNDDEAVRFIKSYADKDT